MNDKGNSINNPLLNAIIEKRQLFLDEYISAYILIKVEGKITNDTKLSIYNINEVARIDFLLGPSDFIIYLEASSLNRLKNAISNIIHILNENRFSHQIDVELVLQNSAGKGYSKNSKSKYKAWSLININTGDPDLVIKEITSINTVKNAHCVLGKYDVISYLEAHSLEEITQCIDYQFKNVKLIQSVDTRIVIDIN